MSIGRRNFLGGAIAAPLLASAAEAETWQEKWNRELLEDFAMLGRYRDANRKLLDAKQPVNVVFMGDSITEGWKDKRPGFWTPGRINRGISGQTTAQMVLRMVPDVIDLKPRAVHIMGGTNDIAGNTGPMSPEMTRDNIQAMVALARHHGLKVILATIPPAESFPWRPGLQTVSRIRELNAWIRGFSRRGGVTLIDYDRVLATPAGAMRPGLAFDGVHPTEAGYDAMAGLAEPALARVLGRQRAKR
jgi:lysophospholipase L1-like esterase